ncbi:hypothetical protein MMC26_002022 [Xylographa opegraphella]|nr:hypothetical protein [Xylographa opegraphella]
MGAPRRKNLIASRRRVEDDEEEEGSVTAGVEEDSLSEGSAISDADDDADAEGSDTSDIGASKRSPAKRRNAIEKQVDEANAKADEAASTTKHQSLTPAVADTEAMMNGMKISDDANAVEEINFDDLGIQGEALQSQVPAGVDRVLSDKTETLIERRRREHEEYKQKRDADPAFVPNRGGFFMHDHRSAAPGQNGFRPSGRGRGRGRGGFGAVPSPMNPTPQAQNPADAPWAHDLHETVAQIGPADLGPPAIKLPLNSSNPLRQGYQSDRTPPPNRSFSKTTRVANVQIRVFVAGMKDPIIFSAVPVNQHTRLPHHRPPLRRDKPVRISLPDCPPRYIFPALDRSFIFIPRALRPNQQGFGRGRGRGSFSAYGGFASRRTSVYGGSNYSPSVAMSRRSSQARENVRDGLASPAGSAISRNQSGLLDNGKPVVRLPPSADQGQRFLVSNGPSPVVNLPQAPYYPVPQTSTSTEGLPSPLPMYQPRPQKTVSVADIESPATMDFNPPQQQMQQPFHQQVPIQVNGQGYPQELNVFPHSRHPSHPSQRGTPLSQIPERAIHAQPFHPFPYQQAPPAFYPQQYAPPVYYYPSPAPAMGPSVAGPAFVPGQAYPFVIPGPPPPTPPEASTQAGTVAHESNGMVYYYDSSQISTSADSPAVFQPVAYAPQNGYMVPQPAVYYSAQ